MEILDPHRHTMVSLSECARLPNIEGYVPVRPFGREHWFLLHPATGQTSPLALVPLAEKYVQFATQETPPDPLYEAVCDAVSSTVPPPDVKLKAVFVDGNLEPLAGFPLVIADPPPALLGEFDATDIFSKARPLHEAVSRREGLLIDVSKLTVAEVDAAFHRLSALGYDGFGLLLGPQQPERADAIRRIFGNPRVRNVAVEDAKKTAGSFLNRPPENPKGKQWRKGKAATKAKKSSLNAVFTPPVKERVRPRKRREEAKPLNPHRVDIGESIEDEDPHNTVPGWQLPDNYDWKTLSYGCIITDGRGHILLREPANHYDGYVWTFAKGKKDNERENPVDVAKREAKEETGQTGIVIGYVPGAYKGGTGTTYYYLMQATRSDPSQMDDETYRTRWATPDDAAVLIALTKNSLGRSRDLAVLQAAAKALKLPYDPPPPSTPPKAPGKGQMLFGKLGGAFLPPSKKTPATGSPKVNMNPWAPKPYKPPIDLESLDEDGGPANHAMAAKLARFIKADREMSKRYALEVIRPIALYQKRGKYNREMAPRLARHLVVAAGRAAAKSAGLPGAWHKHFTQKTRAQAEIMVRNMGEKDASGHKADPLLPAKYRKGFKGYGRKSEGVGSSFVPVTDTPTHVGAFDFWIGSEDY